MGVTNVNGQNSINIIKLALSKKKGQVAIDSTPEYLKMSGSIFNGPNATSATKPSVKLVSTSHTSTRQPSLPYMQKNGSIFNAPNPDNPVSLTNLNTQRSLSDLSTRPAVQRNTLTTNTNTLYNIDSTSEGKAAQKQAESAKKQVQGYISTTQGNTRKVAGISTKALRLDKNIIASDKDFAKKLKIQEDLLKRDNEKLTKTILETEKLQQDIDNAQHELDTLLSTNSYSIATGNGQSGTSSASQGRIKELRALIGSKTTMVQANGKTIYSLQRSSSKTLSRMQRTNNLYIKSQKQNVKTIEQQETQTDKIIKTATTIEMASAITQQLGQLVTLAGVGLVALGSSLSWTGGGAALIAVGKVMQKVGTVTEMIGQYGQTAANLTKTAAYAASGNLLGAMTSATAAGQTGAAAIKSTKNLKTSFGQINEDANKATQKLAANDLAREEVKNKSPEELGGLSKKNARKAISSELQEKMANNEIKADGKWSLKQVESLKANAKATIADTKTNAVTQALENAKSKYNNALSDMITNQNLVLNADGSYTKITPKGKTKTISGKKITRQANKAFKNGVAQSAQEAGKSSASIGQKLQALGNGITNTAAMLSQFYQSNNTPKRKTLQPMRYSQRMQKIMNSRQTRLSYSRRYV